MQQLAKQTAVTAMHPRSLSHYSSPINLQSSAHTKTSIHAMLIQIVDSRYPVHKQ